MLYRGHDHTKLSPAGRTAVEMSLAVFSSTVYAQDFKDTGGDHLMRRHTYPILYPAASRIAIGLTIPMWSVLLSFMWKLDRLCATAFIVYGFIVGARFMLYRTVEADRLSCEFYSVSNIVYAVFTNALSSPIRRGSPCTTYSRHTGTTSTVKMTIQTSISSKIRSPMFLRCYIPGRRKRCLLNAFYFVV